MVSHQRALWEEDTTHTVAPKKEKHDVVLLFLSPSEFTHQEHNTSKGVGEEFCPDSTVRLIDSDPVN